MATVRVSNPKNFALTQGKEYEVIARNGRKISVINDNNITAEYFASVFQGEGAEVAPSKEKKAPVLPTVQEVLATFIYDFNNNRLSFNIQGNNFTIDFVLGNSSTLISCGIRQIYSLNDFYDTLTEFFEEEISQIPAQLRNDIIDAMFVKSVEAVMQNVAGQVGMFVLSTNENTDYFPRMDNKLQPLSVVTHSMVNPNSGNPIKLWILTQ